MNTIEQYYFNEITKLTLEIEKNHPELYALLDENPITIPSQPHSNHIEEEELKDYLESLTYLIEKQKNKNQSVVQSQEQ